PQDLSMLLVGPTGKTFVFFSDAGSTSSVNGINLNLDDTASSALPQSQLTTGTFKPASYLAGITFPSPAPAGPFGNAAPVGTATLGSVFTSTAPSGRWSLYAIDRADGGGSGSLDSWCLNFTLNAAPATTTSLTPDANPAVVGQQVTFTATAIPNVTGLPTPTGTMTFQENGNNDTGCVLVPMSAGSAQCKQTYPSVSLHQLSAIYSGDGVWTGSTSGFLTETINKASTSTALAVSPNPSTLGQLVTLTATVQVVSPGSGTPAGSVAFFVDGDAASFKPIVSGVATFKTAGVPTGSHTVRAAN